MKKFKQSGSLILISLEKLNNLAIKSCHHPTLAQSTNDHQWRDCLLEFLFGYFAAFGVVQNFTDINDQSEK